MRKLIYGVGINNFDGSISKNGKHIYEYKLWQGMLRRCYSEDMKIKRPTYSGCLVHQNLLEFSNFYNFIRGVHGFMYLDDFGKKFHMDKDLLGCGKLYSEETICFLPCELNAFLTNKKNTSSDYPIGVLFHKASGKLISSITINGMKKYLGIYDNQYDAFFAYKKEKESYAKFLAEKYVDVLSADVYKAISNYTVNIND